MKFLKKKNNPVRKKRTSRDPDSVYGERGRKTLLGEWEKISSSP